MGRPADCRLLYAGPIYNFNSTGQLNTINRDNTGIYLAFLPGLIQTGGNPQVTAYGGSAARCEVADWFHNHVGTIVSVYCVNATGVAADTRFSLSYTFGTVAASQPHHSALGAYAWASNPTRTNYVPPLRFQFDNISSGPLTAQRFGGLVQGQYSLTVPNPSNIPFATILGMVTANGSSGEYCNTTGVNVLSGEFYLDLVCYDSAGRQLDSKYTGTFMISQ